MPAQAPARGGKWSDFRVRLASAIILGPIALLALWTGGLSWTLFLAAAFAGLGAEWAKLSGLRRTWVLPASLLAVLMVTVLSGWVAGIVLLAVLTCIAAVSYGWFAASGLPYVAVGGLSLLWLRLAADHGLAETLFLVIIVWGTDIGAYLTGRVIGGAKLAPKISPGKTWSGSVGGLLTGGFCGALFAGAAQIDGWAGLGWRALPFALAISIVAQAGDLLESAIKRKLGVKDSGQTIPGHGGLFDRLDGFLAAAPLAAILALSAQGGLPAWL